MASQRTIADDNAVYPIFVAPIIIFLIIVVNSVLVAADGADTSRMTATGANRFSFPLAVFHENSRHDRGYEEPIS
jgi:hypothetical protein